MGTVTVTTLDHAFLRGVEGECAVENFPLPGETVTVEWQQTSQHLVMTPVESSVSAEAGTGLDEPGRRL